MLSPGWICLFGKKKRLTYAKKDLVKLIGRYSEKLIMSHFNAVKTVSLSFTVGPNHPSKLSIRLHLRISFAFLFVS